jgi:hypothetical protein
VASHDGTTYVAYFIVPDDHARGLSTFTVMAGLGGSLGYALGAIDWDVTALGKLKIKGHQYVRIHTYRCRLKNLN